MSDYSAPATNVLTPERFDEVVDLVRRMDTDPAARDAIENAPDIASAFSRLQQAYDSAVQQLQRGLRSLRDDEWVKKPAVRSFRSWRGMLISQNSNQLRSPELALVLGEIGRVADMDDETVATMEIAPTARLDQETRSKLGGERHLEGLLPLVRVAHDIVLRARRREMKEGEPGLGIERTRQVLEDLEKLQDRLQPKPKTVARANIGHRVVADIGSGMASQSVLPVEDFAKAFQTAYDEHWHTRPKTKAPTGGFTWTLRQRAIREGKPELLVVLGASSDGRCRDIAGISGQTPVEVYDKMIYDNALHVLQSVVQNPRFDDNRAYSMINTKRGPQISAVMTHGRVDMAIRVIACKHAIAHPDVDPMHIYYFLSGHTKNRNVPKALWREYIKEMQRRLTALRAEGDEEQIREYEGRIARVAQSFTSDMLKPYQEAKKEVDAAESGTRRRYSRHRISQFRDFLESHEFIKDPELLNIIVEGVRKDKELIDLLRVCVQTDLPVTKKLTVRTFQHPSREVRTEAMKLLPNMDEEKVEQMARELEEQVAEEFEAVREHVLGEVIPDFEQITGTPRELSRNRHFFEAADDLGLEELVEIYSQCYEKDPRTIPETFRERTELRRHALKYNDRIEAAQEEVVEARTPGDEETVQGDLFGANSDRESPSSMVKKSREAAGR